MAFDFRSCRGPVFVLFPRCSAPSRLRRNVAPRSPRSSAEAKNLDLGLASVHVSVDLSIPVTFNCTMSLCQGVFSSTTRATKSLVSTRGVSAGGSAFLLEILQKLVHSLFGQRAPQPQPRTMQDLSNQIKLSVEYRQQCRQAGVNPKNLWHLNASVGEWFGGRSRPTNCSTAFFKILKYFECECPWTIAIQFTD